MNKNNNEFASIAIDKFIIQQLYGIENPSDEEIKEKMERLEKIEYGQIKTGLSDIEVRINATNLFSKDIKTGKVFFSFPLGQLASIKNFGNFIVVSFLSNTCMTNQAFSGI